MPVKIKKKKNRRGNKRLKKQERRAKIANKQRNFVIKKQMKRKKLKIN
jgi:hypothetical protein